MWYNKTGIITLLILLFPGTSWCQRKNPIPAANDTLTIVYEIKVIHNKSKSGIEETYNGGIKTVMMEGNKVRMRLVSLMRISNTYFYNAGKPGAVIIMAKESGKKKFKSKLSTLEWKTLNKKYDSLHCQFTTDSLIVAGFPCKKAVITLKNGKRISAYYTNQLAPLHPVVEPLFSCIPGIVLQYELATEQGSMLYKASMVSKAEIDDSFFIQPGADFPERPYCISCP
jgi:hypothetical protein